MSAISAFVTALLASLRNDGYGHDALHIFAYAVAAHYAYVNFWPWRKKRLAREADLLPVPATTDALHIVKGQILTELTRLLDQARAEIVAALPKPAEAGKDALIKGLRDFLAQHDASAPQAVPQVAAVEPTPATAEPAQPEVVE